MRRVGLLAIAGLAAAIMPHSDLLAGERLQEKTFEKEIAVKVRLKYLLALPKGYDQSNAKYPLLLFLHGAGESGDDLALVKTHGLPKLIEEGRDFPFIVVSPQTPIRGTYPDNSPVRDWNVDALNALLDEILSAYRVDEDRVYLTGLSMGGNGTWRLAAAYPERFAAIAPVCGWGTVDVAAIKNLPIWVFHGAKDPVVPIARSEELVKALKDLGANPRFTVYPDADHDSWTATYDNPELYKWFLAHKRRRVRAAAH